jgi:hypothetical protein
MGSSVFKSDRRIGLLNTLLTEDFLIDQPRVAGVAAFQRPEDRVARLVESLAAERH